MTISFLGNELLGSVQQSGVSEFRAGEFPEGGAVVAISNAAERKGMIRT